MQSADKLPEAFVVLGFAFYLQVTKSYIQRHNTASNVIYTMYAVLHATSMCPSVQAHIVACYLCLLTASLYWLLTA